MLGRDLEMEALFAFTGQTDLAPNGTMHNDAPASSVTEPQPWTDPQPATEPQPPTQTVDSLREALEAAHVRIAYFERFGPWIEQQMSAVVEQAATMERESEHHRDETMRDVATLRAQAAEEIETARETAEEERNQVEADIARKRDELSDLEVD